jgi:ribose 5-phosphate isomerase A
MSELKREAGEYALRYVQSGMRLCLGTGSTAAYFVRGLGERLKTGALKDIIGVPTSESTARIAQESGVPLASLDDLAELDLAVDGADEVDPQLNLIKGLGGALMREKIVEIHARRFIVIVDETKLVKKLGEKAPVPVEVARFACGAHARWLAKLGCTPVLRKNADQSPYVTDNDNYILDCRFADGISDPNGLEKILNNRAGILEHGLFLNMASLAIVASPGGVRLLEK